MNQSIQYLITLKDKMSSKLGGLDKKTKGLSKSIGGLNSMMGIFAGALVLGGIKKATEAWDKQEQAVAQVRAGLTSTGGVAGRTLDQLISKAQKLQKDTLFGDEEILKGVTAQLLTFTNIAGKEFDKTSEVVLDVTTRLFGAEAGAESLRSTSIMLGKALNDPTANMGALSRAGIQFSVAQKDIIKGLQKSGDLAGAQTLILKELENQYGGSASAAAKAGLGPLKQLGNTIGDITEKIGGALMPTINILTGHLHKMIGFIKRNKEAFKFLLKVMIIAIPILGSLTVAMGIFNAVMALNPISLIVIGITLLISAMVVLWKTSVKTRAFIKGLWEAMKTSFLNIIELAITTFGALKDIIMGVLTMDFAQLSVGLVNIKKGFSKYGKAAGDSFTSAYDKEVLKDEQRKLDELKKKKAEDAEIAAQQKKLDSLLAGGGTPTGVDGNLKAGGTPTGVDGNLKAGVTRITSASPKIFNINITSLVDEFSIHTTNLSESLTETKQVIVEALSDALNETQIAAG